MFLDKDISLHEICLLTNMYHHLNYVNQICVWEKDGKGETQTRAQQKLEALVGQTESPSESEF